MDPQFLFELEELLDEGQYETVLERLEELGEDEMNSEYRFAQATALFGLERSKEALSVLQTYYEEPSEDDLRYHLLLAQIYYDLFEFHAALREARSCLKINDNVAEVWFLLFSIYEVFGAEKAKTRAYQKAVEADEEYVRQAMAPETDPIPYPDYSPKENEALSRYLAEQFGGPALALPTPPQSPEGIHILLIPASPERDYFTLVTYGGGVAPSPTAIDKLYGHCVFRAEFAAMIPTLPDLEMVPALYGELMEKMVTIAAAARRGELSLQHYETISDSFVLQHQDDYNGFMFSLPFAGEGKRNVCFMPDGKNLVVFLLRPLYENELYYAKKTSGLYLMSRMKGFFSHVQKDKESLLEKRERRFEIIHRRRIDTCVGARKKPWLFALSAVSPIVEPTGTDLCLISELVTVSGMRITFMYREEPDPAAGDSGWRFLSGQEDDRYLSDLSHADVFDLNTVANIDVTIIEYLDSPPGSAFLRLGNGFFIPYKRS